MFDFEQMEGNPQRRQRQISEKFQQFPGGLLKRMHQVTAFFLNYNPHLTFFSVIMFLSFIIVYLVPVSVFAFVVTLYNDTIVLIFPKL